VTDDTRVSPSLPRACYLSTDRSPPHGERSLPPLERQRVRLFELRQLVFQLGFEFQLVVLELVQLLEQLVIEFLVVLELVQLLELQQLVRLGQQRLRTDESAIRLGASPRWRSRRPEPVRVT
jgi:hypothetical protein